MQILIIFLIWYFAFGKDNPKLGKDLEEKLGFIIVALIALSVLGGVLTILSAIFSLLWVFLWLGIPIMMFVTIYKRLFGRGRRKYKRWDNLEDEMPIQKPEIKVGKSGLVKSASKRRKLIEKFSKKYNLFLEPKEIDRICDASYASYEWEQEVIAMTKDYDSVAEWYASETGWLRAYLRAFSVQSVSSDFELQKRICFDSFAQVFESINMRQYPNIDACIEDINMKFYTFFDETTFMLAYRFMEANGRRYKLPEFGIGVQGYESEIDLLKKKYDQEASSNVVDDARRRSPLR